LGLQHDLRPSPTLPWRITLHLRGASAERLGTSGEASAAKAAFMGALKSSDFVRHGNTRRVGNLRKEEQDRMWEGVCAREWGPSCCAKRALADESEADEWGTYQAVASKLLPAVPHDFTLAAASSTASSSATERASVAGSIHSAAPSASAAPGGATAGSLGANAWGASSTSLSPSVASTATGASPAVSSPEAAPPSSGNGTAAAQGQQKDLTARRTPLRIHLPDAPVLMEAAKAWSEDGASAVHHHSTHCRTDGCRTGRALPLSHALSATFPLLFPPTSTFAPERTAARARSLARVYVHGVEMPSETPLPWLGGAAAGADGW
jgi:autophagy-related protein 5